MRRTFRSLLLFVFIAGCVEPYEFVIPDGLPGIAIDAQLTDKSFHDTQLYPSDGRYQSVRLTRTTAVSNVRPQPVSQALVELVDDQGGSFLYVETETPGLYIYPDPDFSAKPGRKYKLRVNVEGEAEIESSWESLPEEQPLTGEVKFKEVVRPMYRYEASKQVVRDVRGIETYLTLPPNNSDNPIYYRWSFEPMFIYVAPLDTVRSSKTGMCWIRNPPYLRDYALREDRAGGYDQPLFFMETIRNYFIYTEFSALVKQHILSRDHFYYYKEMQDRNMGGFLQDTPPYNLRTNFTVVGGDAAAFGYFAPVREQATRWYFRRQELSYALEDTSKEDCLYPKMGMAPQCLDCREYDWGGEATDVKPAWWR